MDERRRCTRPDDLQRSTLSPVDPSFPSRLQFGHAQGRGSGQIPSVTCGRSAAGSASPCQGEGRGFESRRPLCVVPHAGPPQEWVFPKRRPQTVRGEKLLRGEARQRSFRQGGVAEWLRQGPAKPCTRVRFPPPPRAISSVGERYLDTVEVTGSIPVSPTSTNGSADGTY